MRNLLLLVLTLNLLLVSCKNEKVKDEYLVSFSDKKNDKSGYKNPAGEIIIPAGKYDMCLTDTFKTYAIVLKNKTKFIGIDREENELYEVYNFDNGPDYPSEGLFRIKNGDKVGFADALTGEIIIDPIYMCAFPFEEGIAKVAKKCTVVVDGEHSSCESEEWIFINRKGKIISKGKI